jgi:hypothetical protein
MHGAVQASSQKRAARAENPLQPGPPTTSEQLESNLNDYNFTQVFRVNIAWIFAALDRFLLQIEAPNLAGAQKLCEKHDLNKTGEGS